jgi:tetratricopeptide (TPR) repeat protein
MAQLGRNEHCHCGSGKKYKKCCLAQDEAAAPQRPAAAPDDARRAELARLAQIADAIKAADELDELSNQVPALVRAGRLDEAEAVCRTLKEKYPDQIDWLERGAMVAKARGDNKGAADLYRRCVAFTREHDGFDEGLRDWMIGEIDRLDPGSSPSA